MKEHHYRLRLDWTGNQGEGTRTYQGYSREHRITAEGRPTLRGSSDPAFRGDATAYNPELLLLASLSSCHMLWYLHLCSANGIAVLHYADDPEGLMTDRADGAGAFARVVLRPSVTIASGGDPARAQALHTQAHEKCFIANSVNFPVLTEPAPVGIAGEP